MQTFWALMERDTRVLGRDFVEFSVRVIAQPLFFVLVFGYVLPEIGQVDKSYANLLLPGIMAATILMTGILGTTIPLSQDFSNTKEIEDRLMAPISTWGLIAQKITMGTVQAWISAILVFPLAWLIMKDNLNITITSYSVLFIFILLVGLISACGGLALGTLIDPMKIPLMFAVIIIPAIFLGATYYPWSALSSIKWLQYLTLMDPVVYASEGFRSVMTPQISHIPWMYSVIGLLAGIIFLTYIGVRGFLGKAYS